jgi:hypothetical protein
MPQRQLSKPVGQLLKASWVNKGNNIEPLNIEAQLITIVFEIN